MRQIKFRGKSIGTGEWLFGNLFKFGIQPPTNVPCICACVPTWKDAVDIYNVHENTVGQFTGVCDMDGKEIYEGDVLVIEGIKTDRYSKVWWKDARFTFYVGLSPISAYLLENGRLKNFRVAGNIYDNPELKEKLV
jgi:uncharacterized phage protein (TIGR01671 family)